MYKQIFSLSELKALVHLSRGESPWGAFQDMCSAASVKGSGLGRSLQTAFKIGVPVGGSLSDREEALLKLNYLSAVVMRLA